jgi:tetratricopeptide (TPR) repeat protein
MAISPRASAFGRFNALNPRRKLIGRVVVATAIVFAAVVVLGVARRVMRHADPDRIWQEAEANLRAGRPAEARAKLRQLESLRSETPQDWVLRAQILTAEGQDDEALIALQHVSDSHPLAAQAWLMAARIERQHKRIRKSESALRRAIDVKPGLVEAHKELVYILGVQLRRREIDAEFKALGRLTPLSHHDLFTWGLTHFTAWGPDIADDLESFIKADPCDRYSRLALATLLVDAPEMENRVERVLGPLPASDAEATALRIELKLNHGQIDEAISLLKNAPARSPNLARIRGRLALLHGERTVAIHHFRDALTEEPYDRVSLSELGKALMLERDNTAAQTYLARARRLDDVYNLINRVRRPNQENEAPDLAELGKTCEAAGLVDEARGWYRLAIGRDPLDSNAQQALASLREPKQ